LAIISIIVVVVAVLLPLTPIAGYLGFVAPPSLFFASLVVRHFVISVQRNGPNGISINTICIDHTEPTCGPYSDICMIHAFDSVSTERKPRRGELS